MKTRCRCIDFSFISSKGKKMNKKRKGKECGPLLREWVCLRRWWFAWTLFQQLKNRRVLSGKCNSVVTEFPANINEAVFTNYDPTDHLSGVSKDWISVINLDDEFKLRGQEILELLDLEPSPWCQSVLSLSLHRRWTICSFKFSCWQ